MASPFVSIILLALFGQSCTVTYFHSTPSLLMKRHSKSKQRKSRALSAISPSLRFTRSGAYVPPSHRTSLRFAIGFSAACSASYANVIVSTNNLNDPGLSLSSNKCVGYTFWASMYKRYRVIGSRIRLRAAITASATAGVTQTSASIALYPSPNGTTLTTLSDAAAQPYSKFAEINSAAPRNITHQISTSKLSGQKDVMGADKLEGIVGAAPGEEGYWVIGFSSDAAYTNSQVSCELEVTYDVIFSDRQDNNRSVTQHFDAAFRERVKLIAEAKDRKPQSARVELKDNCDTEPEYVIPPLPSRPLPRMDQKESGDAPVFISNKARGSLAR